MYGARHYSPSQAPWPALPGLVVGMLLVSPLGCAGRSTPPPLLPPDPSVATLPDDYKVVSPYAAMTFLEAEIALASGDVKSAIALLTASLTSESQDPLIRVRLAAAWLAAGNHSKASALCQEVLDVYPHYDMALIIMGDIAMAQGIVEEAESYYRETLEHEPTSWEAYTRLIHLYREAGDPASALDMVSQLLEADPVNADGFLTASELALELNLTDDAFTYMAKHIEQLPVDETATDRYGSLLTLADTLIESGDNDRALFLLDTYLGLFPKDPEATMALARGHLATGDTLAAREALSNLPSHSPDAPASHVVQLASLWLLASSAQTTLALLSERFDELGVEDPPGARVLWIEALAATLQFDDAEAGLAVFASDEERFLIDARSALAVQMFDAGLPARAWALLASTPADIPFHLADARVRAALSSLLLSGPAPELADQVTLACSASVQGRVVLLSVQLLGTPTPDGHALSESFAEIQAESPPEDVLVDAMVLEATCLIEGVCKDNPTAILSLTARIAELAPTDARLDALRGMFYLATGNVERATLSLTHGHKLLPSDPLTMLWLARVRDEQGHTDEAHDLLVTALALKPPAYVRARLMQALCS